MVLLGVGKNMVRAMRFWVQAAGIAMADKPSGYVVTDFGKRLLDPNGGLDPFLEHRQTLWLLHWKLSTHVGEPLFAWDFLINRWPHPEMTRSDAVRQFAEEARRLSRKLSAVTLEQHFDTFLHTYTPTRSLKGEIQEDNLDCPLVELEFIQRIGDRESGTKGRREAIFAFRREPKNDISPELFAFCLNDFWQKRRTKEQTLTFRDVAIAHGSPGQVFKLPEWDVRQRLDSLNNEVDAPFKYEETAAIQRITKREHSQSSPATLLAAIYDFEEADAHPTNI